MTEATTVTEFFEHLIRGERCLFWWPLPPRGWLVYCEVVTCAPGLKVPYVGLVVTIDEQVFLSKEKILPDGFPVIRHRSKNFFQGIFVSATYSDRLHAKLKQDNLDFQANLFDKVIRWPHLRIYLPRVDFDHPSEAMLQVSRYADELEHLGLRLEAFSDSRP